MNVNGPAPIATLQSQADPALELRLNQRLSAEVLNVSGDRVLLAVRGVQIVARLTSPEQASALSQRRLAQFVVRDLSSPVVALEWVQPGRPSASGSSSASASLIPQLLQQSGLAADEVTVTLARALISQGLPVTAELIQELHRALSQARPAVGEQLGWGQVEAHLAAALKAQGLPVTAGSLSLASSQLPSLVELLGSLKALLQQLSGSRPSAHLAGSVRNAMAALDSLVVRWSTDPAGLAEELRRAALLLGLSLEGELAQGARAAQDPSGVRQTLMALANLRRELAGEGSSQLLQQIDRFLDGVRQVQFFNAGPEPAAMKDHWLRLDLPLDAFLSPRGSGEDALPLHTARLRIAYRPGSASPEIDPNRTRCLIRVDLDENEAVQVDLSLADRRIGALVTATSEKLRLLAESELPSLQAGLERLGYVLQTVRCETSAVVPASSWEFVPAPPFPEKDLCAVSIQI